MGLLFDKDYYNLAMEHAEKRSCSNCKGIESFEMDLFGEVYCVDCKGRAICLVSNFEKKRIQNELNELEKANMK